MSRREAVLSAGLVFLVALVVRAYFAGQIVFPKPEDTAYYVGVARNIVEGRGLVSDALWSYATPPLDLPAPGIRGVAPAADIPGGHPDGPVRDVIRGGAKFERPRRRGRPGVDLAPGDRRRLGTGVRRGTLAVGRARGRADERRLPADGAQLGPPGLDHAVRRDRARRLPADDPHRSETHAAPGSRDPRLIAVGVLLGLGCPDSQRNDLVGADLGGARLAIRRRPGICAPPARRHRRRSSRCIVFAPWAYRNLGEFGSPLPGQAITNALYLTGYDIFAWNDPPTLARHLALGPGGLVQLRLTGLAHNLFNVLVLLGLPMSVPRPACPAVAGPWLRTAAARR